MRRTAAIVAALAIFANLSRAQSDLRPDKQALEQRYAAERMQGAANPAPRNPNIVLPSIPALAEPAGIVDDSEAPFSSVAILVKNRWQDGNGTTVYAGSDATDLQQGLVVIFPPSLYPTPPAVRKILTPVAIGAVRIVAQEGNNLVLCGPGGAVFTFNAANAAFTSSSTTSPTVLANQVAISTSGLAFSRVSQLWVGTMSIKNIGSAFIAAPIQVVLSSLTPGVTLSNYTNYYNGSPVIAAPTAKGIAPGQSLSINLQFSNPSNAKILFMPVAYTGSLE